MKRSSLIYGFNPYALRSAGRNDPLVAVSLPAQAGAPHCGAAVVGAPTAAKTAPRAGTSPYYFIAPGAAVCYNGCTAPLGRGELHRLRGSQPRRRE